MNKFNPINKNFPYIIHGGDYNPDQWRDCPEILDEDIRLMKLAGCNAMTLGIFSWVMLEPEEGKYDFSFMDYMFDKLNDAGIKIILATPSGARPAWMSKKYPEILRVNENRVRILHGDRHNHCYTSPVYREKTSAINTLLAQRYGKHPALLAWHISNEYNGACHCELCQAEFRKWLKEKYKTLDNLNKQWWTHFWSHTYTDWEQIESPTMLGEHSVHGMTLDWKRFVTARTVDFLKNEIKPLREITPDIPITTNTYFTSGIDMHEFKNVLDVVAWDSYPDWHGNVPNDYVACDTAFIHDIHRMVMDGKPFMMMESTPSLVNWRIINRPKRPGMHRLSALQAIAHGSDTVQYFQWRKSRGSSEKFHGAVVDHCGHEKTRVFSDVSELGRILNDLLGIVGSAVESDVALFYDWDNHWTLDDIMGYKMGDAHKYVETCVKHHYQFWKRGINVDVISRNQDFSKYRLLVIPMGYIMPEEVANKVADYVRNGGTVVATYMLSQANENDLCHLGGFPGAGLGDVFGIWSEETDALFDGQKLSLKTQFGDFNAVDLCEIIHANTARVLGVYDEDYYKGTPCLTVNEYGNGKAYYIACRDEGELLDALYDNILTDLDIESALENLPKGITAHKRGKYLFVENYNNTETDIELPDGLFYDVVSQSKVSGKLRLPTYGVAALVSE